MKHFPILLVQTGIAAGWRTPLGIQCSAAPMLGSACSSGKMDVSSDCMVGAKYKELRAGSSGSSWWPQYFQSGAFSFARRLKRCCLGAIRLLDQLTLARPALGRISILAGNELFLFAKLKLTFKRRNFGLCCCLRRDLHWLMSGYLATVYINFTLVSQRD